MITSNVKTRRKSTAFVAWMVVAAMIASVAMILSYGRTSRADVDVDITTYSVTFDLKNGDEPVIVPVKDGDNAYDVLLAMLRQEDPSVDKVPDPEWDNAHVFSGWVSGGEPYDLHTPVHKNTLVEATWTVINDGWEIDLHANERFSGEITDKGAKFDNLTLVEDENYALWVCYAAPAGLKPEDVQMSQDGGKTWEDFSKYTGPNPRDDGRYDMTIQYRCSLEELESHLSDKSAVVFELQLAKKSTPENIVKFQIEVFPENFALQNREGRKWYVIENWELKIHDITVTYKANGGANDKGEDFFEIIHNSLEPLPLAKCEFAKDGQVFIAWSQGENGMDHLFREDHVLPGGYFKDDATFTAIWADQEMWIVNFECGEGAAVEAQMVVKDGQVVKPGDPTKDGAVFKYWTLDTEDKEERAEYDFKTPVKEDIVLFAVWEAKAPEPQYGFGDFVERLYTVALGRESEPEGKAYWIEKVQNGEFTGGYCALFFLTGPEFLQKKTTDEEFLVTVYATFFDREPEPDGLEFWLKFLKDGGERKAVVESFVDSKEWCNLCAKYGVKPGAPTAKAEIPSEKAKAFAERLYTKCLGREAEEDGLMFWALKLTNLEATGSELARDFFNSKEYLNKKASDEDYVKALYETFMGREAEADGLKFWVEKLKAGEDRNSVLKGFALSPEFTELCQSYGIERGSL